MQRLLKVVGALGLGLVIGGAAQADDHKKPTKQKQESNKQGSNKPTSESPGTGNTTPAGNATTAKNNMSAVNPPITPITIVIIASNSRTPNRTALLVALLIARNTHRVSSNEM